MTEDYNGYEAVATQMFIWHDTRAKTEKNRFRNDGVTPYGTHPLAALKKAVADGIYSPPISCAILLHDILEDTTVSSKELIEWLVSVDLKMADSIFRICSDLTDFNDKFPIIDTLSRKERKGITNKHISDYACAGALVVKVYDRWHNLFSLSYEPSFRKKYLEESKQLFSALRKGFERVELLERENRAIDCAKKRLSLMEYNYNDDTFLAVIDYKTDKFVAACTMNDYGEYKEKHLLAMPIPRDQYLNLGDKSTLLEIEEMWLAKKASYKADADKLEE